MATKRRNTEDVARSGPTPSRSTKAERFNDSVFIKRELSADEQRALKAQPFTPEQAVQELLRLCDRGYKLTFKYDTYTNSHAVWASATDPTHMNYGYILTGRGSEPWKALKQLLYKHYQLCNDETWSDLQKDLYDPLDD